MGQQHSFEESSHSNEGWHEGREGKGSGSRDGGGALVQFFQKYNIRNITCTHVVLNFIFECSTTFECLTKVSTVNE